MPFTLAHPALVAPLRRWLVLGAAVCGAMAPDATYFLPPGTYLLRSSSYLWFVHTIPGALTIDTLVGLLLFAVWRWPVRRSFLGSLPEPWATDALARTRAILPTRSAAARWLLVVVSAMVGALSHVLVDSLTHEREGTPDVLADVTVSGYPLPWVLQQVLSVVGVALLTWWSVRELNRVAPLHTFPPTPGLLLYAGVAVVAALPMFRWYRQAYPPMGLEAWLTNTLITLVWGAWVSLLLVSLLLASLRLRPSAIRRRRAEPARSLAARPEPQTPGSDQRTPATVPPTTQD